MTMGPGKKRSARNKATKTSIVFDSAARKEFLTGFRKRKNERRKKAKEQIEKEFKEEKKRSREKAKQQIKDAQEKGPSHRILPEIEHLVPSTVEDVGTHTVSVTHIDSLSKLRDPQADNSDEEPKDEVKTPLTASKNMLKQVNKLQMKSFTKSRAFKMGSQQLSKSKEKKAKLFNKKTAKSKRLKHHNPKKND